jgi:hypothetical protein
MPIPISQWLALLAAEDREAARASADICPCSVRQKSGACIRRRPRARRRRSTRSKAAAARGDPDGPPPRWFSATRRMFPIRQQAWDDAVALDDWDVALAVRP